MRIPFTKMQGAGNDFVVLDETQTDFGLTAAHYRYLANRHFGVGADQILTVRKAPETLASEVDFEYIIHNADGSEVEQCGNGARCFARYVYDKGLTAKKEIRVLTRAGVIAPRLNADGRVTVNMGKPRWQPEQIPFITTGLAHKTQGNATLWGLPLPQQAPVWVCTVSMGNPHAVQQVPNVDTASVAETGPQIENHPHFPQRVNAGYMQVETPRRIRLRVFERGAGETLACGTGACAAVVCGIAQGLLEQRTDVATRGGLLTIEWAGGAHDDVYMTGPATTVFEGSLELPAILPESLLTPMQP